MQFTRDMLRRGDVKEKDVTNVDVNNEMTAKSHNFQN